ncbi:MAG: hypothetical protein K5894_14570 [Lachnospiraceae bacterium]|nr:hypothetical protein [Lachnospiraceae bacterium]
MIVAYEPFSTNLNHVPVNSEFLNIIADRFPDKKIVFYGEKTHMENVRKNVGADNVVFKDIKIIEPSQDRVGSVLNEKRNVQFISSLENEKIELLVVLNSHPHNMYFVKKYVKENIPVLFIIHGNIEELKRKKHIYQLGYWIKPAFGYKKHRKNKRYLVLGDSIRTNLLQYIDYIRDETVAVPHPYTLYVNTGERKRNNSNEITMGMIGSFSSEKRSNQIFVLEKKIKESGVKNIKYLLVGSGDSQDFPKDTTVRFIGDGKNKLSENDYNNGIEMLDFILFFWPKDSYQMTASGALCDAIVHNKPIISIRNDYLTWVFNEVGDLGFLCEDIDEMADTVCRISRGGLQEQIQSFNPNFQKAREFFSRANVARIMDEKSVWMI